MKIKRKKYPQLSDQPYIRPKSQSEPQFASPAGAIGALHLPSLASDDVAFAVSVAPFQCGGGSLCEEGGGVVDNVEEAGDEFGFVEGMVVEVPS